VLKQTKDDLRLQSEKVTRSRESDFSDTGNGPGKPEGRETRGPQDFIAGMKVDQNAMLLNDRYSSISLPSFIGFVMEFQ
jgi:hypothetical protein